MPSLPTESKTAAEIVAWCTSRSIYLASFMKALSIARMDVSFIDARTGKPIHRFVEASDA